MDSENDYTPPAKLKKTIDADNHNDIYCFNCHHEGEVISCDSCPRVYHPKCLGLIVLPERIWTCPECEVTQSSFNIINQSTPSQRYSINEFHTMLKYALRRLKSHPQAEHFMRPIDSKQISKYLDYIIHPMDFETIEKNINSKKYSSTEAFFGDIKWILHNSIIYNGSQSKLTTNARTLLKIARHEMTEIEICPECYLRSMQPASADWFTQPCTIPHTLCWAKMKTYQPWPAKVLRIVNDEVDVRFFGQHDRAWVSLNHCFVLSKEYPGVEKKKSNINLEKSLAELQRHIDQLKKLYGHFTYAPPQTLINKTKPFRFVSIIDDSILPSYITAVNSSHTFYLSLKQQRSSSESNIKKSMKRYNENSYEYQQSPKRTRISSKDIDNDNNELQSTLNVFDIFNQSDQIRKDNEIPSRIRASSPTDNKLRIQALLRKYIQCQPPIIDPISSDVRSSMNGLLDTVEALKTISEVHTNVNNQKSDQHIRTKKPRKSNLQHHIIPKNNHSNFITCSSLDPSFSTALPFIPLRPLSVSPPSVDTFQSILSVDIPTHREFERTTSIEILNVKSELIDNEEPQLTQSFISTNSLLVSPSLNTNRSLSTSESLPRLPKNNIWPSVLSINTSTRQAKNKTSLRKRSNGTKHSHLTSNIPKQILPHANQLPLDDHETRDEIQTIINTFNDQFQQLLVDMTGEIESSLQTTRMKYEKDLEETRRSYRISLDELHSITTKQVQEIHNSLELQYWKRLSDMRNRYESKLQFQ